MAAGPSGTLPAATSVLAVVAHPDDESFGLGALLAAYSAQGAAVAVLCLTHGEATTLGAGDLATIRAAELAAAGEQLGVGHLELLDHPDGRLAAVPLGALTAVVAATAAATSAELLLVFDEGGVTGHPDHERATASALAAPGGLAVLAWSLDATVAGRLNEELGTRFLGRDPGELDLTVVVERHRQLAAIACHRSQSEGNATLWRRLELQGEREHLRWLRRPPPRGELRRPG